MNSRAHSGYVFLVSVLVIGIIATATASSLLLLGWAAEQNGLLVQQSLQAYEYAHTCAERALRGIRGNPHYAGDEEFAFGEDSCRIEWISGVGNEPRNICVSGTSGDNTRRMEIEIDRVYPRTIVRSWKEVSTFTLCP